MSTSETVDFEVGPCPCGNGKIVKHVTTQDNPWSSADISHTIACLACTNEWRIENGNLIKRGAETAYRAAQAEERLKYDAFTLISSRLVNEYFATFSARTKKSEHAEMTRLGVYKGSYRAFLKAGAEAKSPADVCYALGNRQWLSKIATQAGISKDFGRALGEFEEARKRTSEAYDQIVRRSIPNRRSIFD